MAHSLSTGLDKGFRELRTKLSADLTAKNRTAGYDPEADTRQPRFPPARSESIDTSVPDILLKGTRMTKISEKKKKQIFFRLEPDEGQIIYESRKGGIVPIETIKEIRTGSDATYYRTQFGYPWSAESRWITIIYILEGEYKTLHILAETEETFELWNSAIHKLYAVRQGLKTALGKVGTRQRVWERQYWKGADKEGDQKLDFANVESLCKRLNVNMPAEELKRLFSIADSQKRGYLDFAEFQNFVKVLKERPEIDGLYGRICAQHHGKFDIVAFQTFMRETQKSNLSDEELQVIFLRHTSDEETNPNTPPDFMSLDGFSNFLLSPDNAAFSDAHGAIWQDMTHPISHYYISASHNTYLVGHQLMGVSTIEGYIRALLHSCRSVELDVYDGDEEPVIYHGKTLTKKVAFREVCHAIAKYAFVASPYPVIISAEVHCGVGQQEVLVQIMKEEFGSALISVGDGDRPKIDVLPSPEALKGKFLLKAKNLYVVAQLAAAQAERLRVVDAEFTSSSSSEDEAEKKGVMGDIKSKWRRARGKEPSPGEPEAKPKVKMSMALASLLVYTVGVKCHGIGKDSQYAPEHIFSLSENSAGKFLKAEDTMKDLIRHNMTNLVRIYPKGTRVDSSNYDPQKFWAAGAQVVAINWQTFDSGYMINQAMFQRNGKSGFVLKPRALWEDPALQTLSVRTTHSLDITVISAQQLPRPRNGSGQEIIEKSIVDPFVEVTVHVPEWTRSPYSTSSRPPSPFPAAPGSTTTPPLLISKKTRVVKDNGFNPVWNQELNLSYDSVGGESMKELIFVQFNVRQKGKDGESDIPLAMYITSLACLNMGFRHLPLHDMQLSQHLFSTLYVHVASRDL
ncbi:PLC-like phosphodiesterase [Pluteus cervinus]|uniref:PLC-like phosphodiesterase n=1 Tax=Pluteus cervinus TaxID=181527 RepID=A0ACD3AIS1_9AGAR|nr:PLC-like phosphodiesterase [Pluteus cervinus]